MLVINRNGKLKTFAVTLNNREGTTQLVKKEYRALMRILGADLETLEQEKAKKLEVDGGVQVTRLYAGKLRQNTNIREGFVVTKVDGQKVRSVEEFIRIMEGKKGGVMLEGIYADRPGEYYYAFGM